MHREFVSTISSGPSFKASFEFEALSMLHDYPGLLWVLTRSLMISISVTLTRVLLMLIPKPIFKILPILLQWLVFALGFFIPTLFINFFIIFKGISSRAPSLIAIASARSL